MSIAVHIPSALRVYSRGAAEVMLSATSVRSALEQLEKDHPELYTNICDETGAVRRHINLFVNHSIVPVRDQQGLDTAIQPGDVLMVLTAVSGG
jgi:molybdopterin converting factor small subunit